MPLEFLNSQQEKYILVHGGFICKKIQKAKQKL